MFYGGDYNPEQWPEEVWKEDVELMRRLMDMRKGTERIVREMVMPALRDYEPAQRAANTYWIALGVAVLTGIALYFVVRSPLGSALVALRDNSPLAAARGISPRWSDFAFLGSR